MHAREDETGLDARVAGQPALGLLERVAVTVGSALDLTEVLRRLAEMVREVSSGRRCTVLVVDDGRLEPAVAIGAHPGEDLSASLGDVAPIDLGPEHRQLLRDGQALAFSDARTTPLIPDAWVERFDLRAVAVVPIVAHGEPYGAMAVDWPEVRDIPGDELAVLEAIGVYAGLAIRNARLHEQVASERGTLERIVDIAAALNSSSSLTPVLDLICASFESILGTTHCSVNLTDPADPLRLQTIATRGEPWFTRVGDGAGIAVPPEELAAVTNIRGAPTGPVVYATVGTPGDHIHAPRSVRSAVLFPLFGTDGAIGAVVTGFPHPGGPGETALEAGQTLAELAATAIGRAEMHDHLRHRLRQLELLYRLSGVASGTSGLGAVLEELNETLGDDFGIRLDAVVVDDRGAREAIGGIEPTDADTEALRGWCAQLEDGVVRLGLREVAGRLLVPVVYRRRLLGALVATRSSGVVSVTDEEFLLTIGGTCGEMTHHALLRRMLAESERRAAVAAERERIARDLHDSAAHLLTGMGTKIAAYLDEAPDETWRHRLTTLLRLARQGEREIREAVSSLVFFEARPEGLARSLDELAARFTSTTGIAVEVVVTGEPRPLTPECEDGLFRTAHEALCNVERHAEASSVRVCLDYRAYEVSLVVEDDGVGIPATVGGRYRRAHSGLRSAEERLEVVGGALALTGTPGKGARLVAVVVEGERGHPSVYAGREPGASDKSHESEKSYGKADTFGSLDREPG